QRPALADRICTSAMPTARAYTRAPTSAANRCFLGALMSRSAQVSRRLRAHASTSAAPQPRLMTPLASLLCALPLMVACGSDAEPEQTASRDFSAFDGAVESFLVDNALSGASVVVVERHEIGRASCRGRVWISAFAGVWT